MTVLHVERADHVWTLTVDRPETRNAIDPAVHAALEAALDDAETQQARAIILTGAGGSFISGGDLKLIRDRPFEETLALSQAMTALLARLEACPIPSIAAIDGYAFGGGCEVMLACDMRVAAPGAKLSFRQAAMGLTTGWGATTRLTRLVPRSVAARLLLAAEILDAAEAARVGIVDEVADDPLARAHEVARAIASTSPRAVRAFQALLDLAYQGDVTASRAREWEVFQALWGAEDHREALAAYFEKRAARFED